MEQELNKKLAKWAGCYEAINKYTGLVCWWYPDGYIHGSAAPPQFTDYLDLCFKWLVPKLNDMGEKVRMISQPRSGGAFFCAVGGKYLAHACVYAETPALALCKAIEKLIDGEK